MKRLAIFAHWDKDNLIEDYVLYYLQNLKNIAQKIIFVSDCELTDEQKEKVSNIVDIVICEKHGEYDFGSYKRGFFAAVKDNMIEDFDELIFANDSCYAPMFPFEKMFEKMEGKNIDFWSASGNYFGIGFENGKPVRIVEPHLQSYFLVFKKQVFTCEDFIEFMKNIKKEPNKINVIINYELGLNKNLKEAGFVGRAYAEEYPQISNPTLCLWDKLVKNGHPFIKTSVLRCNNIDIVYPFKWKNLLKTHTNYPVKLIEEDLKRNKSKIEPKFFWKILKQRIKQLKNKIRN